MLMNFTTVETDICNNRIYLTHFLAKNVLKTSGFYCIAFKIFLTMMVTNCTREKSFSKLKRIKGDLRNSMKQERLNFAKSH